MKAAAAIIAGLLLAQTAHEVLPERVAQWLGHSESAWDFVSSGAHKAFMWGMLAVLLIGYTRRHQAARDAAMAVCAWGVVEAALRPACRLLLPMDRRPDIPPGGDTCTAAGMPAWGYMTPLAAGLCAAIVARMIAARRQP